MKRFLPGLACACILALAVPSQADDGSSQLGAGGIVFVKSADIRMAKEDLYVSPDKVRIRFEFVNDSPRDQSVVVAFPLPDLDLEDLQHEEVGTIGTDPVNFVGFTATVDGKKVPIQVEQKALLKGKDISAIVRSAGLPLNLVVAGGYDRLEKLTAAQKAILVKAGAIDTSESYVDALWTVQTRFYWTQHFPPGKTVVIEHSYAPVTGGAQYYDNADSGPPSETDWLKPFCMDKPLVARLKAMLGDVKLRPPLEAGVDSGMLLASITDYVLSTANTWKGPIGQFHMTLDKLAPKAVLSVCWKGTLKKAGPTTFEFSAANFAPTQDIHMAVLR